MKKDIQFVIWFIVTQIIQLLLSFQTEIEMNIEIVTTIITASVLSLMAYLFFSLKSAITQLKRYTEEYAKFLYTVAETNQKAQTDHINYLGTQLKIGLKEKGINVNIEERENPWKSTQNQRLVNDVNEAENTYKEYFKNW